MTSKCGACRSDRRGEIDASLRAGLSLASVARLSSMPVSILKRHRAAGHVAPGVPAGSPAPVSSQAPSPDLHESDQPVGDGSPTPLQELDALIRVLDGMMTTAPVSQRIDIVAERRRTIEARNRIVGPPPPEIVSLADIPEYVEVERVMFDVLERHVDVRRELSEALRALRASKLRQLGDNRSEEEK